MEETIPDVGFTIGTTQRKKPLSKDTNPETFWNNFDKIISITKLKLENPKWGPVKMANELHTEERWTKKVLAEFFFDAKSGNVFKRSTDLNTIHRKCLNRNEMIELIRKDHASDHRKSKAVYETIRRTVYPVVRETVKVLFDQNVHCESCNSAVVLPKTTRTRKPIPATYPNSRWQIDLKKMPVYRGYNYVCNIVDCYSRFAFGKATKGKTAHEIADIVLHFIYIFGAPRILQSDNGKEFRNKDLEEIVKVFETKQMHGRPYHPQSQGRVERFNRTLDEYFKIRMAENKNWVDNLEEFYYKYNNRLNKATRPSTSYQLFFKRPNFAAPLNDQIPYAALTKEERDFLNTCHLDVDDEDQERDEEQDEIAVAEVIIDNDQARNENDPVNLTVEEALTFLEDTEGDSELQSMPTQNTCVTLANATEDHVVVENSMTPLKLQRSKSMDVYTGSQVSEYYKNMYRRKFGGSHPADKENRKPESKRTKTQHFGSEPEPKRRFSLNEGLLSYYKDMQTGTLDGYPMEQFSDTCRSENLFYPQEGEVVQFRTNPAMNKGTAVFSSGYWRKGQITNIVQNDSCGKIYTVKDSTTNFTFDLNRNQLRPYNYH